MITFTDGQGSLGTVEMTGGALVGSTRPLQRMADRALAREQGNAGAAYARLLRSGSAYMQAAEDDGLGLASQLAGVVELAFDPHELRIPKGAPHAGEWVHTPSVRPGTGIHRYKVPDPERLVLPPPKKAGRKNYYERPEDQPFFQAHPVSPENVIAYYDRADAGTRAQGRDWYSQNHEVARTIGGGNAEEGAILLSAYSPQKPWPYNMFQAMKSARRGRALGPGEGMAITGANQKQAQAGIDGKSIDEALAGPKTHSFGILLRQGDDSPDDPYGHVVIDTHALNVAAGGTVRGDEQKNTPVGNARYHEYVSDQYREAARRISEREGKLMKPHQLQAITWMVQQQENQAADAYNVEHGLLSKGEMGRAKGRVAMTRNAWKVWTAYARKHNVQLIPGVSSLAAQIALSQLIELTEGVRTIDDMAFDPAEPRGHGGKWTDAGGWDGLAKLLDHEFGPDPEKGLRVKHPRSGYMVEAGEWRRVNHPPPSEHGNESLGIEGPATFDVRDHGDPNSPEYSSLKYMNPQVIRTEPIKHVYRGMSAAEWEQAQRNGYISSDRRGAISDLEGTNAAVDPRSAVSYLPPEGDAVVAKIAVRPEHKWFTINADNYLRTRSRVPLSAVEHVLPMRKIKIGKYGEGLEYRQPSTDLAFDPHEARDPAGRWFHGTRALLADNDLITPGHESSLVPYLRAHGITPTQATDTRDRTFFSDNAASARSWALSRGDPRLPVHVYEVAPAGPVELDPGGDGVSDYRSHQHLRVLREVTTTDLAVNLTCSDCGCLT